MNKQEIANSLKEKTKAFGSNSKEWLRKNKVGLALIGIGLTAVGIREAPYSTNFLSLLDHMGASLLGVSTWSMRQEHGVVEMFMNPQLRGEVLDWIGIDTLGGVGLAAGKRIVETVLTHGEKEKRMRDGIEPLDQKESPSQVLIGPSGMISDLAQIMKEDTPGKKGPIIGIHMGIETPAVWGQEMKYHFKLDNPNELIGRFPPSMKKMSFIEATGLDRASEITFACINPDNALFYGSEAQSNIPPTFVSTLIRKLPAEKLRGKKINVIYNEETELGGTSTIAKELKGLAKELGFILNLITPEELFIRKVTQDLENISQDKEEDKSINITLVGQGKTETDQEMLFNFKKALAKIKSRKIRNKIRVSLIQRRHLDRFTTEEDKIGGKQILEPEMREKIGRSLKQSDYILVYGDQDHGTSTLSRLLLFDYKVPKKKIHSIAERLSNQFDFMDTESVFVIYQMIIDQMKQSRK